MKNQLRSCSTVLSLLLMLVAVSEASVSGMVSAPSYARCMIKRYRHCYNLEHTCPSFCHNGCIVECVSCMPMCVGDSSPILDYSISLPNPLTLLPLEFPKSHIRSLLNIHPSESNGNDGKGSPKSEASNEKPSPPGHSGDGGGESEGSNKKPSPPVDSNHDGGSNKKPSPPEDNGHDNSEGSHKTPPPPDSDHPPSQTPPIYVTPPSTPSSSPSSHSPPTTTPSSPSPPSSSTPPPTPPTTTPTSPSPPSQSTPSPTPPTTTPPSPSPQSSSTPPNTTASPSTPTPTPPTTPSNPSPPSTPTLSPPTSSSPPPSTPSTSPKTARCKNKYYPRCYNTEHVCPSACPGGCEIDCATCKPVCRCDRPGAVCQDPRFIGGDGITFYFHGKKDHDFCLVSDPNLHINAHFIGKRNENLTRDFTWVQSISIFFDKHQLFLGALKASTWDDSADRLSLAFDGEPLNFPGNEGSKWQSTSVPSVSITRISDSNNVVVEVEGLLKITAKVVPITEEDSRIHNYGITKDDCFAHLDLGFKFYSLSNEVDGVLGQTYRPGYVSRVNVGAKMAVMGGNKEFATSSLSTPDCAVARFRGGNGFEGAGYMGGLELPSMRCASGIDGEGVVCKR